MKPANGDAAGPSSGPVDVKKPGRADVAATMKELNRPKYNRFTQQELPACNRVLTPQWVISVLVLVGVVFVPIGLVCLSASKQVVEMVHQYDTGCVPWDMINNTVAYIQNPSLDKTCIRVLKVPKDMKKPIYIYYQLDNFYQNHRRYVKSRSDVQLISPKRAAYTKNCKPEATANGSPIVPCGLIAWSLFNDTYSFARGDETLRVNKKGISWKSEREHKFGKHVYPKNFQSGALIGGGTLDSDIPLSEQEDLIVWMRIAALPTFRKLYGVLEVDLKAHELITVTTQNNYNSYSYNGKKTLVLSTTSWLGGKNDFLGRAYVAAGMMCFLLAMVDTLLCLLFPKHPGDLLLLPHYPSARVIS